MASPPTVLIGSSKAWMTSPSGAGTSSIARFSATVWPVTVISSPWRIPSSRSICITTGTPPIRSMSTMWYFPCGFVSARCGTRAATRLKSSNSNSRSASKAIAMRCSTAFVEPPRAMTTAMAFSNAPRDMIWRGRMPRRSRFITAWPLAKAMSDRRVSIAAAEAEPGSDIPMASPTAAMVLAVNIPAQLPMVGQAARSIDSSSSSSMSPTAWAPTASNTLTMSSFRPSGCSPGMIEPPYTNTDGRFTRAAAMSIPGSDLSQPAKLTKASRRSACMTASTESAMISRLTRLARMPS